MAYAQVENITLEEPNETFLIVIFEKRFWFYIVFYSIESSYMIIYNYDVKSTKIEVDFAIEKNNV